MSFDLHLLTHHASSVESLGPMGSHETTFGFQDKDFGAADNVAEELTKATEMHNS
jgi:hypothetical protein